MNFKVIVPFKKVRFSRVRFDKKRVDTGPLVRARWNGSTIPHEIIYWEHTRRLIWRGSDGWRDCEL
jgi:hypothetical protein